MSPRPGEPGIQSVFLEIVLQLPDSPGKRRALIRLLWREAAGPIISQHVTIRSCRPNGQIAVEVDDPQWLRQIRNSSRLIVDRINTALNRMKLGSYHVSGLDIYEAPPKPPKFRKKPIKKHEVHIPEHIQKKIDQLPESLRAGAEKWFKSVRGLQADDESEN